MSIGKLVQVWFVVPDWCELDIAVTGLGWLWFLVFKWPGKWSAAEKLENVASGFDRSAQRLPRSLHFIELTKSSCVSVSEFFDPELLPIEIPQLV